MPGSAAMISIARVGRRGSLAKGSLLTRSVNRAPSQRELISVLVLDRGAVHSAGPKNTTQLGG